MLTYEQRYGRWLANPASAALRRSSARLLIVAPLLSAEQPKIEQRQSDKDAERERQLSDNQHLSRVHRIFAASDYTGSNV